MPIPVAAYLAANTVPSIVNSIFGSNANKDNREAQIAMQREQNAWSARQAQIARDWNSPQHQMQMFQEAGLNPLMSAGGFEPTSPAQVPSSPNVMNPNPVNLQGSDLSSYMSASSDSEYKQALTRTENALRDSNVQFRQNEVKNLAQSTLAVEQTIRESIARVNQMYAQTHQTEEQTRSFKLSNDNFQKRFDMEMQSLYADISSKNASASASYSMAEMYKENASQLRALTEGILFQNDYNQRFQNQVFKFRVGKEKTDFINAYYSGKNLRFQYGQSVKYDDAQRVINLIGNGVSIGATIIDKNPVQKSFENGRSILPWSGGLTNPSE